VRPLQIEIEREALAAELLASGRHGSAKDSEEAELSGNGMPAAYQNLHHGRFCSLR
jgi:hypothetical protein